MTADLLRAKAPVGRDVSVTFRPNDYSSRTATVSGTVVENRGGELVLGIHPDLVALPVAIIEQVGR